MDIRLKREEVAKIVQRYLETTMPGHVVIVDVTTLYADVDATATLAGAETIDPEPAAVAPPSAPEIL